MTTLLDAFCGAGGATKGYQRAGFYVVGVDIKPQFRYCGDEFVQADAIEYIKAHGHEFDAIHASPPCQAFTQMSAKWRGRGAKADEHPDHLTPTLAYLRGRPGTWVVENVPGARRLMRPTFILHGGMFGLGVHRPRLFEASVLALTAQSPRAPFPIGVYGTKPDGRTTYRYRNNTTIERSGHYTTKSLIRAAKSIADAREAMGIDWMTWEEIREAIPPAYTEFVGRQLMQALKGSK